jgi:hypothetical protein
MIMITLARPADHDRFNATVYELLGLCFVGTVLIDGVWDPNDTLDYLEQRMCLNIIPTLRADGSFFCLCGKYVLFINDSVVVTTRSTDVTDLSWLSDA